MSQTGTGRPFSVIPWDGDFLTPLKNMIGAATGDRPGRAVVIFPNSRPRRYMEELYLREGRPMLLPRMITVDELLELCRAAWLHTPPLRRAVNAGSCGSAARLRGACGPEPSGGQPASRA